MCSTADFPHKNNQNIVEAFESVNEEFGNSFYLVLTSDFSESSKQQLLAYSNRLVFCGKVDDHQLYELYKNSAAVICLSLDEGLGLPLFEAAYYDKPVVAADITVYREIAQDGVYFADPTSISSIKEAWLDAVSGSNWTAKLPLMRKVIADNTWDLVASRLEDGRRAVQVQSESRTRHPRLEIVMPSPLESQNTLGVTLQSVNGLLAESFRVTYSVVLTQADASTRPYFLGNVADVSMLKTRNVKRKKTARLYAVDDSDASAEVLRSAIYSPATILLNTTKLHQHRRRSSANQK